MYTREDVAKHNTSDSMWVYAEDKAAGFTKVYDFTQYVEPHPGGSDAIMQHAGGDVTEGFYGSQHPAHVYDTARKFLIGRLAA
ncbi:cytochrome b5 domain-containing protein [archaeon]|nr:MAG: cytochrome b5 domain-containing protein [archaeon]